MKNGILLSVTLSSLTYAGSAHAECIEPVPANVISQLVTTGTTAFLEMEEDQFRTSLDQATRLIPCLNEGLSGGQAANYHKLDAFGRFLDRDHWGTVASFKAVLMSAPGYELSPSVAPDSHPLRIYFGVAEGLPTSNGSLLPRPKAGWIHIDGAPAAAAPVDRPYVFQLFDDDGALVQSEVVFAGQMPDKFPNKGTVSDRKFGISLPLAATSIVLGGASFGAHLLAQNTAKRFWDPETPKDSLISLQRQTNGLSGAALGLGIASAGTASMAVVVGSW